MKNKIITSSFVVLLVVGLALVANNMRADNGELVTDFCSLDDIYCEGEFQPPTYKTIKANVYAYSSTTDQTDSNPFVTADGSTVGDNIIANNCLAMGSRVALPAGQISNGVEVYEIKEVHDRMNSRYGCNDFDVWLPTRQQAIDHGVRQVEIEVL